MSTGNNIGIKLENWFNTTTTSFDEKTLRNKTFNVLGSAWDNLVKSGASASELDKAYRNGFIKLGKTYITHLDKTYGDGKGNLTLQEYIKSELAKLPLEYKNDPEFIQAAQNIANNINVDGNTIIDEKEMAAVLSVFDKDCENGNLNGKINGYDYAAYSMCLIEGNNKIGKAIRQHITNRYNQMFGTNIKAK